MAVRFDASGEHYTQSLSLGLQGAFSVSMWARLAVDRNTWGTFLAFQSTNSLLLEVGNDGTSLDVWDDDAGSIVAGPTTLTIGTWYYLAYSAQAGANASFLYVRAADSSVPFTDTWTQGTRTLTTLWLGNNQYGEWINGNLAAVKFWTAGLTQAELELESRQYTPNRVANLQAFYPLVRAQTTDYSGNARTLSGGTGTTTEDGPPIPWRVTSPRLILPAAGAGGDPIAGSDSGTVTEGTAGLQRQSSTVDSAIVAEVVTLQRQAGVTDTGTVGDVAAVQAILPVTDSATFTESASVGELANKAAIDGAAFTDAATVIAVSLVAGTDTAAVTDISALQRLSAPSDSAALTEAASITVAVAALDTATLPELALVGAGVSASDSAVFGGVGGLFEPPTIILRPFAGTTTRPTPDITVRPDSGVTERP